MFKFIEMVQVTLELPNSAAKALNELSREEKNLFLSIMATYLNNRKNSEAERIKNIAKLRKTMADIGKKAAERGLTDDILKEILAGA